MYDSDRDGLLTHAEFNELMQDISSHVVQQQVEGSVRELHLFELTGDDISLTGEPVEMISYDDFQMVMEEHHILPSFATPHQKSDDSQIEAYRDLHAPERCVRRRQDTLVCPGAWLLDDWRQVRRVETAVSSLNQADPATQLEPHH